MKRMYRVQRVQGTLNFHERPPTRLHPKQYHVKHIKLVSLYKTPSHDSIP